MKTRMVQERIGELLGPVDWSFNFDKHCEAYNEELKAQAIACLRKICDEPDAQWEVRSPYTGNWSDLLAVGMYDGWPYWRPVPSVNVATWMGGEWQDFTWLRAVRKKPTNHEREAG